jgi:hypothetical protein
MLEASSASSNPEGSTVVLPTLRIESRDANRFSPIRKRYALPAARREET